MTETDIAPKRAPARPCIFCGKIGVSNEHLWPRWMHDLLPDVKRLQKARTQMCSLIGSDGRHYHQPYAPRMRQGSTLTTKIRAQCRSCNSGWMSQVEEAARPYLTTMIGGSAVTLTPAHQRAVATWIALKTVIGEYSHAQSKAISAADCHWLKHEGEPPARWLISLACCDGTDWRAQYAHEGMTVPPADGSPPELVDGSPVRNIQSTTIGLGRLIVQASSSATARIRIDSQHDLNWGLVQIWPPSSADVYWPGAVTLDDSAVNTLALAVGMALQQSGIISPSPTAHGPPR